MTVTLRDVRILRLEAMPDCRNSVSAEAIGTHVARVKGSKQFGASPRLQEFLQFVVDEALAGRADTLKEHTIAVSVYGRPSSFDPKLDSIVRTEARRLRARLQAYYQSEGAADHVRIELPLGRYVPEFVARRTESPALLPEDRAGSNDTARDSPAETPATAPQHSGRASARSRTRTYWVAAGLIAIVLVLAAAVLLQQPRTTLPGERRVSVLIVPFDYEPGLELPVGSLESAIEFALTESRMVQAVPRVRVTDAFRLMRLDPATRLTPDLATEVAARDSAIDVVLTGDVTRQRNELVVSAGLREAATTRALASIRKPLKTPDEAFTVAASLATWVRSLVRDVDARREQLEPAATRSITALRAYSRGLEQADEQKWAAAEALFRDAIADDPQFASAHIRLAWALRAVGRSNEEVLIAARRAEALAAHASEQERLFIRASVRHLEGRLAEALQIYEALVQAHPDHPGALGNLTGTGFPLRPSQANAYWRRYADLRPNDANLALETATQLAFSGAPRALADRYLTRARSLDPGPDASCLIQHVEAFHPWTAGDVGPWLRAVDCAARVAPSSRHAIWVSLLLLSAGRPSAASDGFLRTGDSVATSRWSAIAAAAAGDRGALRRHALDLKDTRPNALSTILQAWAGERESAAAMAASRTLSVVPGASPTQLEAFWQVAEAELGVARGETLGTQWSDQLRRAMTSLEATGAPEYFIAAHRLSVLFERRGDVTSARRVLEQAVSRRAEAYPTSVVFWLACLDRLAQLERQGTTSEAGTGSSRMLAATLAAAEPGFNPAAVFSNVTGRR
ncbi:hypothetical protein TBR22_A03500 [Luteitalea sp. TBR-22]|uniref:hypothetical protein n=1 Tax=Luteitalea sp. TBR-22 TaxID=2802971 RepID=UPI001EF6EF46|nr:hypothetical protein [Luteitalea sp. TBR-22]BCS31150.2 hypothetical protein TBR22_A03500 [Luteitalea sp. TBR-22]